MPPRVEPGARAHLKPCIGFGIRTAILAGIVLFPPMAATGLTGTFDDPISIVSIDGYTTCCLPD
jgi:hypothetical protein